MVTTLLMLFRETDGIHWETQTYHLCRLREQNAYLVTVKLAVQ